MFDFDFISMKRTHIYVYKYDVDYVLMHKKSKNGGPLFSRGSDLMRKMCYKIVQFFMT